MANTRQGLGMMALTPSLVAENPISSYSRAGLTPGIARALDAIGGLGFADKLGINSGYRSPARNQRAGGAKRSQHLNGNAVDINISKLSPAERQSLLDTALQAGVKGVGIYRSGNTLHIDARKSPAVWGPSPLGAYKGLQPNQFGLLPEWSRNSIRGLFGLGSVASAPTLPSSDIPTPTPRPDLSGAPMLRPDNVAYTGPNITGMRAAMPSPMRPDNVNFAGPAGNFNVNSFGPVGAVQRGPLGPASLPPDRPMPSGPMNAPQRPSTPAGPSLSTPGQALAYGQLGGTMALAGIRNLDGTPAANVSLPPDRPMPTGPITPPSPNLVSNLPTASVTPTISPVAPPTQVAPVYTPPRTVAPMQESSFPAAPPAPTRPSVSDVYAGMPGTAISNAGIEVSRAPGGFIDRYNPQFDVTTVETPQGYQAATLGKGRLSRTDQARSLLGNKQLSDKAKRTMGTMLGGLLGGAVAGPMGGILGGVVGNRIAGGGVLGGVLGYGANYFPDAPTRPDASWGPGMSDSDLRSYAGDRVADAVKAGRAGLY